METELLWLKESKKFLNSTENTHIKFLMCNKCKTLIELHQLQCLFDETQNLLVESDLERYWFIADSVPTSLFCKCFEALDKIFFFPYIGSKLPTIGNESVLKEFSRKLKVKLAVKILILCTRRNTCLVVLKVIPVKIQHL